MSLYRYTLRIYVYYIIILGLRKRQLFKKPVPLVSSKGAKDATKTVKCYVLIGVLLFAALLGVYLHNQGKRTINSLQCVKNKCVHQ